MPRVTVVGFDQDDVVKHGLPIIERVTKAETKTGHTIIIRAKHMIWNMKSPVALASTHQMRELGITVDNVSEQHIKDKNTHGTLSIVFPNSDHVIKSVSRDALPTFSLSRPTMEEHLNAKGEDIVDIAMPNSNHKSIILIA